MGGHAYHEMVRFAVLNGAEAMLPNAHGLTPAMAAVLGGNAATVCFLVRATPDEQGSRY